MRKKSLVFVHSLGVTMFITVFITVMSIITIIGCAPEIRQNNETMLPPVNESSEIQEGAVQDSKIQEAPEIAEGSCLAKWVCISSSFKAFQLENCSIGAREECPYGCTDGICQVQQKIAQEACIPGFKCKSAFSRGFQSESCTWRSETKCDFGCKNGECNAQPNETAAEDAAAQSVSAPSVNVLKVNEQQVVGSANISIYIIENFRVKLLVNSQKSDWLASGQTWPAGGRVIIIRDILYQPYAGGTQGIEYTVE